MAHAQKPDGVFRGNGRVHLNRWGHQFSRLLAAEVCASAFIVGSTAGYTMFRGSMKGTSYSFHSPVSPSLHLPCATMCHHISTGVYTNPICQAAQTNKFCFQKPNICESSAWKLFQANLVVSIISRWLLKFWKIFVPLLSRFNKVQ